MTAECAEHCSHCCPYHCVRFRANKDAVNYLGFGFLEATSKVVTRDTIPTDLLAAEATLVWPEITGREPEQAHWSDDGD